MWVAKSRYLEFPDKTFFATVLVFIREVSMTMTVSKTLLMSLALLFIGNMSYAIQDSFPKQQEKIAPRWVAGEEQYKVFSSDFQAGKFDIELKTLSQRVDSILQQQPALYKDIVDVARKNRSKIDQFHAASEALMAKRDRELQQICEGHGSEQVCQLISSIISNGPQERKFNEAFNSLHLLAISEDQSSYDSFTKKAVEIVNEGMKKLLFPMYSHQQKDEFNPNLPKAIEMDMMEKLKKLVQTEPNNPLAVKIDVLLHNYPVHFASFVDNQTLALFADGKIAPANATEQSVQKAMQKARDEGRNQMREVQQASMGNQGQEVSEEEGSKDESDEEE